MNISKSSTPQNLDRDLGRVGRSSSTKLSSLGIGGANSTAYEHKKSNTVLKVTDLDTLSNTHANYQFLRLAMKHQDNPYFPKIYKAKAYPGADGKVKEITMKMEKLYHLNSRNFHILFDELGLSVPYKVDMWTASMQLDAMFRKQEFRQQLLTKIKNSKLREALRLLEPLFKHYTPDVHCMNWMVRANNELVITDPVI